MIRIIAACLAFGVALVANVSAAHELDGDWRLHPNQFQSEVTISIRGDSMSSEIGCESISYSLEIAEERIHVSPELVISAPCDQDDRRNDDAWAYWRAIGERVASATSYRRIGDTLILRSPAGRVVLVPAKPGRPR